jgi:hypothetical protein
MQNEIKSIKQKQEARSKKKEERSKNQEGRSKK